jgi:hypothetical protein
MSQTLQWFYHQSPSGLNSGHPKIYVCVLPIVSCQYNLIWKKGIYSYVSNDLEMKSS